MNVQDALDEYRRAISDVALALQTTETRSEQAAEDLRAALDQSVRDAFLAQQQSAPDVPNTSRP